MTDIYISEENLLAYVNWKKLWHDNSQMSNTFLSYYKGNPYWHAYEAPYVPPFVPWTDTVAYYKFDNNLNDSSGNWLDMSWYGTAVYWTTAQWATYATFDWTNFSNYLNWYTYDNSAYTISFWLTFPNFLVWWVWAIIDFWTSTWDNVYIRVTDKNATFKVNDNIIDTNTNQWHYYALVIKNWVVYAYRDVLNLWELCTISGTISTNARLRLGNEWNGSTNGYHAGRWSLSELILETKARTTQEVLDYYNASKIYYWY